MWDIPCVQDFCYDIPRQQRRLLSVFNRSQGTTRYSVFMCFQGVGTYHFMNQKTTVLPNILIDVYNRQYKSDNDFNEYIEQRLSYKQNALEGYLYTYRYIPAENNVYENLMLRLL